MPGSASSGRVGSLREVVLAGPGAGREVSPAVGLGPLAVVATTAVEERGRVHRGGEGGEAVVPFTHLGWYANRLPEAMVRELDDGGHSFPDGLPQLADDVRAVR
jgi:hypothetical protein